MRLACKACVDGKGEHSLLCGKKTAKVKCYVCKERADALTAHLHDGKWIGECCWDDRLKSSE